MRRFIYEKSATNICDWSLAYFFRYSKVLLQVVVIVENIHLVRQLTPKLALTFLIHWISISQSSFPYWMTNSRTHSLTLPLSSQVNGIFWYATHLQVHRSTCWVVYLSLSLLCLRYLLQELLDHVELALDERVVVVLGPGQDDYMSLHKFVSL